MRRDAAREFSETCRAQEGSKVKSMSKLFRQRWCIGLALVLVAVTLAGCSASAKNGLYFGKTTPPAGQVLRYVTGSEPESLDPQISSGQPEARIYMAIFEGLTDYDPKNMQPIPAIAERWDVNNDSSEFVFHLRHNARWSNGDPITAQDFVYSMRRALSPELASRSAYLAYYIKNAQAYNEGDVFVRDPRTNEFLLEKDYAIADAASASTTATPVPPATEASEYPPTTQDLAADTAFHQLMHAPARLALPGDEKGRAKLADKNPKLKAALAGKEFVPVKAEDMGVEAVDDYTYRISLVQSAPFFLGLTGHQLFRLVPRKAIEKYGDAKWTQPGNIVTCGPFKMKAWKPYDEIVVERDPMYWDAANVHLDQISFYPVEDNSAIMSLYKAGEVDAFLNHTVPTAWLDYIRQLKDYMDAPEAANDYYLINTTKAPMNDVRVRKAFNMAIDKVAFAQWRKVTKPTTSFVPEGIFPGYPRVTGDEYNPARAKQLLAEAGYADPKKFPVNQVEITYNTTSNNKAIAEFVQAQWKQNLGITVTIKNMEFKTFLVQRSNLDYKGFARGAWSADYMDPYTFLSLFYTPKGDNGTGWWDAKYAAMLDEANRTLDKQKRYEILAKAEKYMLDAQPVIPLDIPATSWMKKPYVKGLYPNPMTLHAWKFVYIEHDPAKWDQGMPDMSE